MKVPASFPSISEKDLQAVHAAVDKAWFTEGTQSVKFRKKLAEFTNNKYVQLVNSGSSANLVALSAATEVWKGKGIITSALSFPTTIAPIYQLGKIPFFVDVDPKTLSPDIGQIAYMVDKYGDEICGGIFTHMLGFPYDERIVREILGSRFLIADCCDALGAKIDGNPVGNWADLSTYSFFPAHHITTGEGGAVHTNNEELYKIVRSLTNWGRDCYCLPGQSNVCGKRFEQEYKTLPEGYDHKYTFTRLGYNLKMTELAAAMGVTQMEQLDTFVSHRSFNYGRIWYKLREFSEYIQFADHANNLDFSPFGFPIILKIEGYANDLIAHLERKGISTRRIFAGNITHQPGYHNLPYVKLDLENTDYLMENAFWIGCGPWMTEEQANYIGKCFEEWFNEKGLY